MRRCFRTGGPRQALLLVLALSGFGIPGCRPGIEEGVPAGTHAIEMAVLKGREGETLALVPVYIEGKGPFAFALDTGASRTIVDRRIAEELGLPIAGDDVQVSGVGGNTLAQPVRVARWRLAGIELLARRWTPSDSVRRRPPGRAARPARLRHPVQVRGHTPRLQEPAADLPRRAIRAARGPALNREAVGHSTVIREVPAMKTRWLMVGLAAVGLAVGLRLRAAVDEPGKKDEPRPASGKKTTPDGEAILGMAGSFTRAFNAGDASGVAALHTPDARVVDVAGDVIEGREAVEREYAGLFRDNPGLSIDVHVDDLRLVGPDAAIEEGTTRVTPKDGGAPVVNHYSAVDVRRDGRWLLASVRESPGETPSAQDRLRELEWMLGEWIDEAADSVILSTCKWSDDKMALNREFTIRQNGRVAMTVNQRIGWDPAGGQIKSWEFDSEGGHGEGLWARLGDQWMVKATGVLQDGRAATATHVITREDPSTCRWRTVDRTVGGDVIPVADEFVMVRRPPPPKSK